MWIDGVPMPELADGSELPSVEGEARVTGRNMNKAVSHDLKLGRWRLHALCLTCLVAFNGCATESARINPHDVAAALLGEMNPAPTIDDLRDARQRANPSRRLLLERVLAVLETAPAERTATGASFDRFLQVLRDLIDSAQADVEARRAYVSAFVQASISPAPPLSDPAVLADEALAHARRLVAAFPGDGKSYRVLAEALGNAQEDQVAVGVAYKQCVALAPAAGSCVVRLDAIRERLRAPHCGGSQVARALVFHAATDDGQLSEEPQLTLEATPVLTAVDIATIAVDPTSDRALDISITPAAAKTFGLTTARLAASRSWLVMRLGEVSVIAARVTGPMPDGVMRLHTAREPAIDVLRRLCVTLERRALPPELQ